MKICKQKYMLRYMLWYCFYKKSHHAKMACMITDEPKSFKCNSTKDVINLGVVHPVAPVFNEITSQLPLFATFRVFTVHNTTLQVSVIQHHQVCHIYKNAKIILKLNRSVNLVSK
jgi:hypothetical protein